MIKPKARRRVRRVGKAKLYEYNRPMTLAERRAEKKRAQRAAQSNAAILKATIATLKRVVRMVECGEATITGIRTESDLAWWNDPGRFEPTPMSRGQRMEINLYAADFKGAFVAPKLPAEED